MSLPQIHSRVDNEVQVPINQEKLIARFCYRSEIDGLRAVAVLAVVLFHLGLGCSGGYVGVDVFFVISGFLITALIWKDLEQGRFTFANFWERRARRIAPALLVVVTATLISGWFLLPPDTFKGLGQAAIAQTLLGANVYAWLDSGYFATVAEKKPLLHTWSLAVEEQFYLVTPSLLWFVFRTKVLRNRASVLFLLAMGCVLSFCMSVYGMLHFKTATFFLLPTRAWELLMGSLVAFIPLADGLRQRPRLRELIALTGLALIIIPIFLYTSATLFPGLAALPPCLGSALVIWVNHRDENQQPELPTGVSKVLSLPPLVFIGLISYSLYVWHWPLLVFSKYYAFEPLSMSSQAAILGLSLLLAIVSWKYVETPFRKRQVYDSRKAIFAFTGVGLSLILVCGFLCVKADGFPQRFPPQLEAVFEAKADAKSFENFALINLTADDVRSGNLERIGTVDTTSPASILVWGDSHAMAAVPAIDTLLKEEGLVGLAVTHAETAPVLNWYTNTEWGLNDKAIDFSNSILSYIEAQKIPTVLLVAYWSHYQPDHEGSLECIGSALLNTVQHLIDIGTHPYVLLDVPVHPFDVPDMLIRSTVLNQNLELLYAKPTAENQFDAMDPKTIAAIDQIGVTLIDPKPKFLDADAQHYIVQLDGIPLYMDYHHLTPQGANLMLLPLLREANLFQE